MTQQEQIDYWVSIADRDLPVMESLFQNGHYDWSLFIGHLIIEKILKACFVRDNNETPPKIHDLGRLAKLTKLNLNNDQLLFLDIVTGFNIEARYPKYKAKLHVIATKEFSKENLDKIKELFQWIRKQLK